MLQLTMEHTWCDKAFLSSDPSRNPNIQKPGIRSETTMKWSSKFIIRYYSPSLVYVSAYAKYGSGYRWQKRRATTHSITWFQNRKPSISLLLSQNGVYASGFPSMSISYNSAISVLIIWSASTNITCAHTQTFIRQTLPQQIKRYKCTNDYWVWCWVLGIAAYGNEGIYVELTKQIMIHVKKFMVV